MQTGRTQLSADQIVEETSHWPDEAIADLVDRIMRAKYGEADSSVEQAWQVEIRRRISDFACGSEQGIALAKTLRKARTIIGPPLLR